MKIYYVYMLTVKKCGLFYIGVTSDIDIRKRQHWHKINNAVKRINYCRTEYVYFQLPAYLYIAREIIKGKRTIDVKVTNYLQHIISRCTFTVLDIKDTAQEAANMEAELLSKHYDNPKFLNVNKKSTYGDRIKK